MNQVSPCEVEAIEEQLRSLDDLLVREFRACQALHAMTKEERQALASGKIDALMMLVDQKEALIGDIGEIEGSRRALVGELNLACDLRTNSATLADLLAALPANEAGRLGRLGEGIITLLVEVRDMTHGNRAIATTALERANAIQSFLLNLFPLQDDPREMDPGLGSASRDVN